MIFTRNNYAKMTGVIAAFVMTGSVATLGQQTNAPARPDYSYFKLIGDRNIFDPNRYPRQGRSSRRESRGPEADAFSLVGTMSYEKGTFAFFDGTSSEYRKALQLDEAIAGYKVTEITPNAVKLQAADKRIEMKVGTQMRKESEGGWQLIGQAELPASSAQETTSDEPSSGNTGSSSSAEPNDVLKKLMQQREQELK